MTTRAKAFDIRALMDDRFANRFWMKVDKIPGHGPNGDCWAWSASVDKHGYGQFLIRARRSKGAHRVAWALTNGGLIPDGSIVRHTCDNPPCVRPEHLTLGTQLDNVRDSWDRGRARRLKGEHHHKAVLTEDDVRVIRAAPYYLGLTADLAVRYGVSQDTIRSVRRRETWQHVA